MDCQAALSNWSRNRYVADEVWLPGSTRGSTSEFRVKQGERGGDMQEQRESTLAYLDDGSDGGEESSFDGCREASSMASPDNERHQLDST